MLCGSLPCERSCRFLDVSDGAEGVFPHLHRISVTMGASEREI